MSNKFIRSIRDLEITNKTIFLRVDFNVPLSDPDSEGVRKIEDDNRIQETLPTIQYAIEKKAKIVLASHLGRPKGKVDPQFSLQPIAEHLANLLGIDVMLADDCIGDGIDLLVRNLKPGQVILLENLRFHKEEEGNDPGFSGKLGRNCQVYINDAFGTAHRKHASTYGVAAQIPTRGMGFLIEKELKFLDPLLQNPAQPFWTVLGGSKVSDKIKTIESLLRTVNGICIGGAMAHAFSAAMGEALPPKAKEPSIEDVNCAASVIRSAKKNDLPLLLPIDTNEGFDIGPKTIGKFKDALGSAKTIFWNGPVGWFEKPEYATGTRELAEFIATTYALKIVGGGDTVSAIEQFGLASRYDHLSTGGGAVLEYLEGNGLPGIEILKDYPNRKSHHKNAALQPTDEPDEDGNR
ncbi:MAG: phosphoglycerate kinase [Xanthomonadaceae bacterium]|nr:phosphoglycerate kinase [Xanthomonadaceae bacterium]